MTQKNLITVPVGKRRWSKPKRSCTNTRVEKASRRRRQIQPEGLDHGLRTSRRKLKYPGAAKDKPGAAAGECGDRGDG